MMDLVKEYPGMLSFDLCNRLINKLEESGKDALLIQDEVDWKDEIDGLDGLMHDLYYQYFYDIDAPVVPQISGYEKISISKVCPSDIPDATPSTRIDVASGSSSKRAVAVYIFLNKTACSFSFEDDRIYASEGSVLMFPPFWTFPYELNPPENEVQYIIRTFLHYSEQ